MPSSLQNRKLDDQDLRLIMHCRKSLLFFGNETWKRKSTESGFDITVDNFVGAEICQLHGFIFSQTQKIFPKIKFGLY